MQLSWFSSPFPNWQFVLQKGWSNISYAGLQRGFIYKEMLSCYDPVAGPQNVATREATYVRPKVFEMSPRNDLYSVAKWP